MTLLISHIQKTAGRSLRRIVEQRISDVTFLYDGEVRLSDPNIDFIAQFRRGSPTSVIMGHFSFGVHRLLGVAPRYVTVLREPVERIVSLYRHYLVDPGPTFAQYVACGMTLAEFVSDVPTEETNNHMTRIIAGIPPEAGLVISDRWLLDLALHNLKRHYVLVGSQAAFPSFVSKLSELLGWGNVNIPFENRAQGEPVTVDRLTRRNIMEKNALDLELYERVIGH